MVGDVEANNRCTTAGRSPFDQENLRDLAILPKIFIGAQSRNELADDEPGRANSQYKLRTSSFAF